jgi:integrase
MPRDLKDLKKFKGNDYGSDFILVPVDRKNKVEDIKNLELHEVNVCGYIGDKNETGNRRVPVKLLRLDKLKDGKSQFGQLWEKLEEKKKKARDKSVANTPITLGVGKTVAQLIEKYIDEVLPSLNDSENYETFLRKYWEPAIGNKAISEVTLDDLEDVRDKMRAANLSPSSINGRTQTIKSAFRFGNGADKKFPCRPKWVEHDITKDLKAIDPDNKKERFLSFDELKRLREQIQISESENLGDFFEFLLAVGCRWSEPMGLTWDCVDFKEEIITFNKILKRSKCSGKKVVNGKTVLIHERNVLRPGLKNGENSRIMDLENYPEVLGALLERKKNQMKNNIYSDHVFTSSPRKSFETALRNANIKDFSFHTIRHTCMSYLAQMSATPFELKGHGGHKDIKSVERYAHMDPQITKRTSEKLRAKIYGNG